MKTDSTEQPYKTLALMADEERKKVPLFSGCLAYFPDALIAVAQHSKKGNDQHNPDTPLHWDRSKSGNELDSLSRHLIELAKNPADIDAATAVAWRALANLQKMIEECSVESRVDGPDVSGISSPDALLAAYFIARHSE